jgi:CDP-glycerol glycerophosphotransferase (TagB/SpsB family)
MVKTILIFCGKILTRINAILPKKSNRIMFYSNLGFRDNVKALFDYLVECEAYKNYEIIVATNDYRDIEKHSNIKYVSCVKGVFYFLRTKFFFYAFGKYPIVPSKFQMVINLWHGMPLKKIGNLESGKENNKYDYFSYVLSTGPIFDEIMEKSFNCGRKRILHIGQPRTDALFEKNKYEDSFMKYNKVFIWMPTFRVTDILHESNATNEERILPLISSEKDIDIIDSKMRELNCLLLIKLHPIQKTDGFNLENKSNILFINENYLRKRKLDLYRLLGMTDSLITDYSSVYFDYLLLDKPIIFTIDDIDDYKSQRGLNFDDPLSIMPGPHVDNFDMLVNEIDLVAKNCDNYKEERKNLNNLFNKFVTSQNSKDIIKFCNIEVED